MRNQQSMCESSRFELAQLCHEDPAHKAVWRVQVAYWRTQLAGAPALLELPTDRARPVEPSGRGASVDIELPADVFRGLNELAASAGATLFMALLAAWQVGMFSWTVHPLSPDRQVQWPELFQ